MRGLGWRWLVLDVFDNCKALRSLDRRHWLARLSLLRWWTSVSRLNSLDLLCRLRRLRSLRVLRIPLYPRRMRLYVLCLCLSSRLSLCARLACRFTSLLRQHRGCTLQHGASLAG